MRSGSASCLVALALAAGCGPGSPENRCRAYCATAASSLVADGGGFDLSVAEPWSRYIYAPASRTVVPVGVAATSGNVTAPSAALSCGSTRLAGAGSFVVYDFGKEVGGRVTLGFAGVSDGDQNVQLSFSESALFTGPLSDASNGGDGADGSLTTVVHGGGAYTVPVESLRGGFRYLTVALTTGGAVVLDCVSLAFSAAPSMDDLRAYPNYFYSNDELLNKIWYAGAYTVQLDTIDAAQGRVWMPPPSGWRNDATVGVATPVLVDGAKRDRTVWPGDLGVAVHTAYVTTGELVSTRNALSTLYAHQDGATGELPYAGPELGFTGSDTYHLWTLVGTYSYYLYTGDGSWLDAHWQGYKNGVEFILAKVDSNGLLNVTNVSDWARAGQGGENVEANVILYRALVTGALLAAAEADSARASSYASSASALKAAINARLWDPGVGAYRDNPTSAVYPQDGNSLAVWFGVVDTAAKATSISRTLKANWNSFGAHTPEWTGISPFAGSMEVHAHFIANDDQAGLDLIRLEWGYMLGAAAGTASTFWEGYNDDGSFAYGGSYASLSHGWSTGPTSALSTFVLGIGVDSPAGASFHVIPHPGDLSHAEGRLAVDPSGAATISVTYDLASCGDFSLTVDTGSNAGSLGVVGIPKRGASRRIERNGDVVWDGSKLVSAAGIASADQDDTYVYFRGVQPGKMSFSYRACAP